MERLKLAAELIKQFEGCKLEAYPDPATGKEPYTIGWGNTRYLDGRPVRRGDKITQEEADNLLDATIREIDEHYRRALPDYSEALSEKMRAALISFGYNVGKNWYRHPGFPTLTRLFATRQYKAVPNALLKYVNPGTSVEAGLTRRRIAEAELWMEGMKEAPISLVDAARYWKGLEHQFHAAQYLQRNIPEEILFEFAGKFRNNPDQRNNILMESVFRFFDGLEHQVKALEWLQEKVEVEVLRSFALLWRIEDPRRFEVGKIDWRNPRQRISKYFVVGEVTKGSANRMPEPGSEVEKRILELAKKLDEIRDEWKGPIGVTSWYRPETVNRMVGGAPNSRHILGDAADIFPYDDRGREFEAWLDKRWQGGLGYGFSSGKGFVHVDLGPYRRWRY